MSGVRSTVTPASTLPTVNETSMVTLVFCWAGKTLEGGRGCGMPRPVACNRRWCSWVFGSEYPSRAGRVIVARALLRKPSRAFRFVWRRCGLAMRKTGTWQVATAQSRTWSCPPTFIARVRVRVSARRDPGASTRDRGKKRKLRPFGAGNHSNSGKSLLCTLS